MKFVTLKSKSDFKRKQIYIFYSPNFPARLLFLIFFYSLQHFPHASIFVIILSRTLRTCNSAFEPSTKFESVVVLSVSKNYSDESMLFFSMVSVYDLVFAKSLVLEV